jgi:hypothetical protein
MAKNDDLKIDLSDLSDIFGGDVSDVKESVERSEQMATEVESLTANERQALDTIERKSAEERTLEEISALKKLEAERALRDREQELERRYREMMEARERELEERTRELEARLAQAAAPVAPVPEAPAVEASAVPDEPPPTVDFSAPMPPPFSGGVPVVPADQLPSRHKDAYVDLKKSEEMKRLQRDHEFFMLYDEFRNLILLELVPLVGEKKTHTMLSRTVEMARVRFPDVFKNANWDWDGNLIASGMLDSQRMLENKAALPLENVDAALDIAFGTLLDLRLQAIEKGLGTGMKTKVRARLMQWITEKIEKSRKLDRDIHALQRLRALIPA